RGRATDSPTDKLALDRRPGRDPLGVRHAVLLAVSAVGKWRLPELDGVEVGRAGLVGVVLVAASRRQRLHLGARLRVDRRLAKAERLLGLDLRRVHILGPQDGDTRVRR